MNEALAPYIAKHIDFPSSEKSGGAQRYLTLAKRISTPKGTATELVFHYTRILDDAVDESSEVLPIKKALKEERDGLKAGPFTVLQQELLAPGIEIYPWYIQDQIRLEMRKVITGLLMDLELRYVSTAPEESDLKYRNLMDFWAAFNILNLGWSGKKLTAKRKAVELVNAWATHDNTLDLAEDLNGGLILVNKGNCERFGLEFMDGELVNPQGLRMYSQYQKTKLATVFRENRSAVFGIGLPVWSAALMFLYFGRRPKVKAIDSFTGEGIVFRAPLDSIHRITDKHKS